ncbi:hypothetical protein [Gimesia aquarii]|uniref:Uncharacterized protein n=1 Tax=Gimesia aquarii TaxID=2527964 RepID=A0A517X310_9PLAN|nr:hypothetical protein [Gimesia aquarii]QDU11895.1 hypothetical protein V202x_53200 [Gimesia aquarii]
MKRFSMFLCALVLFNPFVFGEDKACQDENLKSFPCVCPLIDLGLFWIGEQHEAGSNCLSPVPVFLPGSDWDYGICLPETCTGAGCVGVPLVSENAPLLKEPIPPLGNPFPDPKYARFVDPKFVKLKINDKETYVKIFTVVVNVKQIAHDHNLKVNPLRGSSQFLIVGYETTGLPDDNLKAIKTFKPIKHNAREAIIDFGLRKGIVFLASAQK